jgi:hypothetical protein
MQDKLGLGRCLAVCESNRTNMSPLQMIKGGKAHNTLGGQNEGGERRPCSALKVFFTVLLSHCEIILFAF